MHLRGFAGFVPSVWDDRDVLDRPEIGSREGFRDGACQSTLIETGRLSNGFSPRRHSVFAFSVSPANPVRTRSQVGQTRFLTGFDRVFFEMWANQRIMSDINLMQILPEVADFP
jgi:hypothetical protein